MRTKHAREIRRGILLCRDVRARKRRAPNLTPCCTYRGALRFDALPLWEQAYRREQDAMVRDGRLRPPRQPKNGGIGNANRR